MPSEVIEFLGRVVNRELVKQDQGRAGVGNIDHLLAATALRVVEAATNIQGSKELYEAFDSQNPPLDKE